jgi:hypothetical protein
VVSEYDDCRVVSHAYETFPADNALAALTRLCPPAIENPAGGWVQSMPTLPNWNSPVHTKTAGAATWRYARRVPAA